MKIKIITSIILTCFLLKLPIAQATLSMNASARPISTRFVSSHGFSSIKSPIDNEMVFLPYLQYTYGIFQNTQISVSSDFTYRGFISLGLDLQHALFFQEEGLSIAAHMGIGSIAPIGKTPYVYIGPIVSYKKNQFEPYISARALFLKGSDEKYHTFGQVTAGLNLHCTKYLSINLNATSMISSLGFTRFYPGIGMQLH